ncbi:MAG: IS256 family transposase [Saprospiraceae bacterium]|nr:IS256 family transposase [Saprospiraceae bacterium]
MEKTFNFEHYKSEAVSGLLNGQPLTGKDGVLTPLIKEFLEAALAVELKAHLRASKDDGEENRRNGHMSKEVRSLGGGTFTLETPRDRMGTFEPKIVAKRQVFLGDALEEKILLMYAHGMSYESISNELRQIYGIEVSTGFISEVTDKVIPLMNAWRTRLLDRVYSFLFLDAMHFRIKGEGGRVESRMLHLVYGVTTEGKRTVLGMYLAATEGAKYWLQVLSDLKTRGVEDVLIVSVDGLKGFEEAIKTVFPKAVVQTCVVHQIRHSMKFVSDKDIKDFMGDLKNVYQAATREQAEDNLDILEQKWGKKYAPVISSWRNNWHKLSAYFDYPPVIRKVMYTTNAIEGLNRQIRKITKTKGAFPSETALFKLVYLVIDEISKKKTNNIPNWGEIAGQLHIIFGERADIDIKRF